MAGTPEFKVYTASGMYIAACKFVEDAAAIVMVRGEGSQIRHGHAARHTVWTEGTDGNAGDSYDDVARHVWNLIDYWREEGEREGRSSCPISQ